MHNQSISRAVSRRLASLRVRMRPTSAHVGESRVSGRGIGVDRLHDGKWATHDFSLTGIRAMNNLGTEIHLHARVFRAGCDWYADIDDHRDPQPDDPYWYGYYESQRAAIDAACERIAAFNLARAERVSEQLLSLATTPV